MRSELSGRSRLADAIWDHTRGTEIEELSNTKPDAMHNTYSSILVL